MKQLSVWARAYILVIVLAAACFAARAMPMWRRDHAVVFLTLAACAFFSSRMRISLPGVSGSMSVNFVFMLVGLLDLDLPQLLVIGLAGTVGQFVFGTRSWPPIQFAFNISTVTLGVSAAHASFHSAIIRHWNDSAPILLMASAFAMFAVNTGTVSGIIAVTERQRPWKVWRDNFQWTGLHHLVGAAVAASYNYENRYFGWEAVVLTIPVVYLLYRFYTLHLERLQSAKRHTQELGDLHWRAIESLALAIDAKDETTHNHLLRVKVYATELGREFKMDENEMQALQAAALLHDIGKLAVPEYIVSKPGKLTREEFEKMKIHPVVGAEILARVRFPYPVVPIVKAHHEKWNGSGYPDGLEGERIPLGARILAAVDCLDALASDRQYRRAMPLDAAMAVVASESGVSFDPRVVEVLQRRYVELERMATSMPQPEGAQLSKNISIKRGGAPGAGYADSPDAIQAKDPVDVILSVEAAVRELRGLMSITEQFHPMIGSDEVAAMLAARLKRIVPFDAIAVFGIYNRGLTPKFVSGEDASALARLEIPFDQGVSGWVAHNRKPIANGNPSVEPGYQSGRLCSALSVPLEAGDRLAGVLTLYRTATNSFRAEDLQTVLAASAIFVKAFQPTQKQMPVVARKPEFLAQPAFALHQ
jgi:putative nucleotidyltransferase with HDIG domain